MALAPETLRELQRAIENLRNSLDLFNSGSDPAIDLVATTVRTICNWSTQPKGAGYQSLLAQAALVPSIRFPGPRNAFGCEILGLRFFLLDGLDIQHEGKKPFFRTGGFTICKKEGRIEQLANLKFRISDVEFKDNIRGKSVNLEMLPISPENISDVQPSTPVIGIWRADIAVLDLRQKFIDWWANEPALALNGKTYTRQKLIEYVANKSGGAHVSPALPSEDLFVLEMDTFHQLQNIKIASSGLHKTVYAIGAELLVALSQVLNP